MASAPQPSPAFWDKDSQDTLRCLYAPSEVQAFLANWARRCERETKEITTASTSRQEDPTQAIQEMELGLMAEFQKRTEALKDRLLALSSQSSDPQ